MSSGPCVEPYITTDGVKLIYCDVESLGDKYFTPMIQYRQSLNDPPKSTFYIQSRNTVHGETFVFFNGHRGSFFFKWRKLLLSLMVIVLI